MTTTTINHPTTEQDLEPRWLDIRLEVSEAALKALAEEGFDPVYGARPLKRAIQQRLENPLAKEILAGKFVAGQTIIVGIKGGAIGFSTRQ